MSKLLVTSEQIEQADDIFQTALHEVFDNKRFGRRAMDRLLHNPAFVRRLKVLMRDVALPDNHKSEQLLTYLGYPLEYKVMPICEQIDFFENLFALDGMHARLFAADVVKKEVLRNNRSLKKAKAWFVIPNLFRFVENFFPNEKDFAKQYCLAVEKMIGILSKNNKGNKNVYRSYFMGNLLPSFFQLDPFTLDALQSIHQKQPWDIWIIPAQFGREHKGESVHRVRETYLANEFGMPSFCIANMLLTHPERLTGWDQLQITCPGDMLRDGSAGSFLKSTGFSCRIDEINFLPIANSRKDQRSGPVTGFLLR